SGRRGRFRGSRERRRRLRAPWGWRVALDSRNIRRRGVGRPRGSTLCRGGVCLGGGGSGSGGGGGGRRRRRGGARAAAARARGAATSVCCRCTDTCCTAAACCLASARLDGSSLTVCMPLALATCAAGISTVVLFTFVTFFTLFTLFTLVTFVTLVMLLTMVVCWTRVRGGRGASPFCRARVMSICRLCQRGSSRCS